MNPERGVVVGKIPDQIDRSGNSSGRLELLTEASSFDEFARRTILDGEVKVRKIAFDPAPLGAELARIGNNINQIAHAVNRDLAADRPLDAARLLHLLIGIDQVVRELRNDC